MPANEITITSRHNVHVKAARALHSRRGRQRAGCYLIEGVRGLTAASMAGIKPVRVFATAEAAARHGALVDSFVAAGTSRLIVSGGVMRSLAATDTPPGLIAVVPIPTPQTPQPAGDAWCAVVGDRLRDPGNLGAILRSAAALGADAVCLGRGSVDAYSPKVVRAAAGALFAAPVAADLDLTALLGEWRSAGVRLLATAADGEHDCWSTDLAGRVAIVVGNEADGVTPPVKALCHATVRVPMQPGIESLNVAATTAIMLYEVARQRAVQTS